MVAKRKRASSPGPGISKRQKYSDDESERETDSNTNNEDTRRPTRRQTITGNSATPQKVKGNERSKAVATAINVEAGGIQKTPKGANNVVQHASIKKQYGKASQRARELQNKPSNSISHPAIVGTLSTSSTSKNNGKDRSTSTSSTAATPKSASKSTSTSTGTHAAASPAATSKATSTRPLRSSKSMDTIKLSNARSNSKLRSFAIPCGIPGASTKRTASLVLPPPPPKPRGMTGWVYITEVETDSSDDNRANEDNISLLNGRTRSHARQTDQNSDSTQATPSRRRPTKSGNLSVGRQLEALTLRSGGSISRASRQSQALTDKLMQADNLSKTQTQTPTKNRGTRLWKSRSISDLKDPSDNEDEDEDVEMATPTKHIKAVQAAKASARQKSRLSAPDNISEQDNESSSPTRMEGSNRGSSRGRGRGRGRGGSRKSESVILGRAPRLDLEQSDASSSRSTSTGGPLSSVAPVPETDTEIDLSGTEANTSVMSVSAFGASTSSLNAPRSTGGTDGIEDEDVEMEEDDMEDIVLQDDIDSSPSKSTLSRPLPERLHPFIIPQQRLVLKTLRSPPLFEVKPITLGDKGVLEAPPLQQLSDLLTGTCERGEGNSCLLLGPRGSGKTLLLETRLRQCKTNPIVLRLSGYTQTTDRLAMREIAYQLNRQTGATFDIPEEEQDDIPAENAEEVDFTPPAAYLPTLIAQLPSLKRPVVVVLDAFDLFASHPRQALLYCLLDTVQSCRVGSDRHGLLVVGVSCVVNCVNLLEKRVKSRFSHRILKIANPSTIEEYIEAARRMMNVGLGKEDLPQENKARHKEFKECWAAAVEEFLSHKTTKKTLEHAFSFRRDIGNLIRLLLPVISNISTSRPWPRPLDLVSSKDTQLPGQFDFMHRLPQAAMWVLVAVYHWGSSGHDLFNLKMVLDLVGKATTFQDGFRLVVSVTGEGRSLSSSVMAPSMVQAAFEELVRLKVLQTATGARGTLSTEFERYRCMIEREDLRGIVEKSGSTAVKNWLVASNTTTG